MYLANSDMHELTTLTYSKTDNGTYVTWVCKCGDNRHGLDMDLPNALDNFNAHIPSADKTRRN